MKKLLIILLFSPLFCFSQNRGAGMSNRPIDADAQNYITRWETAGSAGMSSQIKNAFNSFIFQLGNNVLWTKFATGDIAPVYSSTAATQAICIKGNNTLIFINSPTHSATGVDWNGTTQYAQTGWIASVSASATSVHVYYYSGEDVAGNNRRAMGVLDGTKFIDLMIETTGPTSHGKAYSSVISAAGSNTNQSGGYLVNKESDIKLFIQRNGTTLGTTTTSNTVTQPTIQLYIGAYNSGGTAAGFDVKQCRFASWGAGMTEAEGTIYNNLVEALQDALGRGLQ